MASDVIYPGTVEWSGENPGIALKETADGPFVTVASFFRVVLSPHGRGHALLLLAAPQRSDAGTATAPNICVTDNEPLARFLIEGYAKYFGTFATAPALAHIEYRPLLGVETGGDPSSRYSETVRAPAMEIGLHWNGLGTSFALALPPAASATGKHTMVSLFAGAAEGVVTLNGTPLPGHVVPRNMGGRDITTAFLAFSETWIRA